MARSEDDIERRRRDATERKRRSRKKRKAGLESYRLYLPTEKIVAAIRVRNKLPKHAAVAQAQIKNDLCDVIDWWAKRWVRIGHL